MENLENYQTNKNPNIILYLVIFLSVLLNFVLIYKNNINSKIAKENSVNLAKILDQKTGQLEWKKYLDPELGFSFDYPSAWYNQNFVSPGAILTISPINRQRCGDSLDTTKGNECIDNISFSLSENDSDLKRILLDKSNYSNLIIKTSNGNKIYSFDQFNGNEGAGQDYKTFCIIFNNGKVLWITGFYLNTPQEDIFNKITQSVKQI